MPKGLTSTTAIAGLLIAVVTYLASLAIYRIYFHPLAKHPGPFWGKLTEWNTIIPSLKGESTRTRHAWSKKYGPVVRIGPNELLFSDLGSVKDIYGQTSSICIKDPAFYGPFTVAGARNIFNAVDRAEHARIRRLLSHAFSMAEIKKTQPRIVAIMQRSLASVEAPARQPVNLWEDLTYMFLDTISELSFDKAFNCIAGENRTVAGWADALQDISALVGMFPLIEFIPVEFVQSAVRAKPKLIEFAAQRVREFRSRLMAGTVKDGSLLKRVVEAKLDSGEAPLSDLELIENAIVFMQAGAKTTISTTCYFLYECDRHPAVKERLIWEIRGALQHLGASGSFPDFDEIENLPYLNQVLDEVLRLRGPIPVNLPRISLGKVIGGHYVPAGTRVCNLAYTTHRDPVVFPDPESFVPGRWENPTPEMKLAFRPFSTGPRNCVGLHLARLQIMLLVSVLYYRYDLSLDRSVTEVDMHPHDYGVMSPQSGKVLFHVIRRSL